MAKNLVNFWFYVNPETQEVEKAYNFFPLGMLAREDGDWVYTSREDSGIDELTDYQIYELDWDKVEQPELDAEELDQMGDEEFTPEVLKMFDSGNLDLETLKQYSGLIYDGTDTEELSDEEE